MNGKENLSFIKGFLTKMETTYIRKKNPNKQRTKP